MQNTVLATAALLVALVAIAIWVAARRPEEAGKDSPGWRRLKGGLVVGQNSKARFAKWTDKKGKTTRQRTPKPGKR